MKRLTFEEACIYAFQVLYAYRRLAQTKVETASAELKSYIIGAMSNFDVPMSTPSFINTWDINYLCGVSKKDKETDDD